MAEKEGIDLKENDKSGCAGVIAIFIIITGTLAFMMS